MFIRSLRASRLNWAQACRRSVFCTTKAKESSKLDYVGIAFFSSVCLATGVLGTWQVKRYFWKVDLIDTIKKSAADPPKALKAFNSQRDLCDEFSNLKGQRVLLKGKYDHSKEVFLGVRSAPVGFTGGPAQGMASNPQGYYVVTPLILEDGTVVHVNRGWVTRALYQQYVAQKQQTTAQTTEQPWRRPVGSVAVEAVVSEGEKAGAFAPEVHPGANTLLWLDPRALVQRTGLTGPSVATGDKGVEDSVAIAEALVETSLSGSGQQPSTSPEEGGNRFPYAKSLEQLQEQTVAPATHFVYAVTWFSLAAAGLVMTFLKFRRGRGASHKGIGSGSGSGGAEGTVVGGRFGDDALSAGKQGHGRGPSE